MVLQKKYIIFGIIGCLCFGIGDWLLGYVDPAPAGMCFLYPGFVHISDIADNEKTKRSLGYVFGLCSAGWLALHILVSVNVIVFSQAEKDSGYELAATLSHSLGGAGIAALFCAYLFVAVSLIKLILDILRQRTYLKKSSVFFTPIVPMGIIFVIAQLLPQSPFSYGLYTFCMNDGMLIWFIYLFLL